MCVVHRSNSVKELEAYAENAISINRLIIRQISMSEAHEPYRLLQCDKRIAEQLEDQEGSSNVDVPRFVISSEDDDCIDEHRESAAMFAIDYDDNVGQCGEAMDCLASEGVDEITSPCEFARKMAARLPPKVSSSVF